MTRFIIRRLLVSIPVLLGIVFLVFVLARVIPGDPCTADLGEQAHAGAVCAAFAVRYGLDQPIPVQFVIYLGSARPGRPRARRSSYGRPVTDILIERLPDDRRADASSRCSSRSIVGIPLGHRLRLPAQLAGRRRHDGRSPTSASRSRSSCSGLLLAFVFAVVLKDTPFALPPSGRLTPGRRRRSRWPSAWGLEDLQGPPRAILDFVSNIYTFNGAAHRPVGRLRRRVPAPDPAGHRAGHDPAGDHRAHHPLQPAGGPGPRLRPHGPGQGPRRARGRRPRTRMRNALLPVVTVIGLSARRAPARGAVLTETIFNLTGVGKTVFEAITGRDYVVIQGVHARHRRRLPGGQPDRRHLVRVPRPADPAAHDDRR